MRATSSPARQAARGFVAGTILSYALLGSAFAALDAKRWITYRSDNGNFSFDYPPEVFSVTAGDPTDALKARTDDRAGRIFTTADGRASLQIATVPNLDQLSVTALRNQAVAASYKGAKLDYNRIADNWYVVSGTQGTATFYERVHFSCSNRRLDVWTVTYPTAESKDFEPVIDEMARRFRAGLSSIRCS